MKGDAEILNVDEAAAFLGVSVKTFQKVLHTEDMPARKIGREWKFSRRALIEWVGSGSSLQFARDADGNQKNGAPRVPSTRTPGRRTAGWNIELD